MTAVEDSLEWDRQIAHLPGAHILQSWEWGLVKSQNGWEPIYKLWRDDEGEVSAAALVLQRTLSLGGFGPRLRVLYIPRGPLLDWKDESLRQRVLNDLQDLAKQPGVIFLKMDPELVVGTGIPGTPEGVETEVGKDAQRYLQQRGWTFSRDQIQFRNTVWMDLTGFEEDWLTRMKQKTRYNLRLAQKKGVTIRQGSTADLPLLYRMYAETSVRDGFVIRSEAYYQMVWSTFLERDLARILIAQVDGETVGGLILFLFAEKAWYLFGMSREAHREKMPNYLLQWEAMRLAKAEGCTRYDLWGAPDAFNEEDFDVGGVPLQRRPWGRGGANVRRMGFYQPALAVPALYSHAAAGFRVDAASGKSKNAADRVFLKSLNSHSQYNRDIIIDEPTGLPIFFLKSNYGMDVEGRQAGLKSKAGSPVRRIWFAPLTFMI